MTVVLQSSPSSRIVGKVTAKTPAQLGLLHWKADDLATLWKDTARTTPVTADGDVVASWKEQGSNNFLTRTAGGGFNPLYKVSQSGSIAGILFDGSNDWLDIPSGAYSALTSGEVFLLMKNASLAKGHVVLGTGGSPLYPNSGGSGYVWDSCFSNQRYIVGDPATDLTAWHVFNSAGEPGNYWARFNNRPFYRSTNNTVAMIGGGSAVLGATGAGGAALNGPILDFVIAPRILSSRERWGLMAYFASRATLTFVDEVPDFPMFKAGTMNVRLRKGYYYCPAEIINSTSKRFFTTQQTVATANDTGNGTVMSIGGTLSGPFHGNGAWESCTVTVDGNSQTFPLRDFYEGTTLVVANQYTMGSGYRALVTSTITTGQMASTVALTGLNAGLTASNVYGRLWGWTNRFTQWATFDASDVPCGSPTNATLPNSENNAQTTFHANTRVVILRDPSTDDTISMRWTGVDSLTPVSFIQDQAGLNKVYLRLDGLNGACNQSVSIGETLKMGSIASGAWPPASSAGL